MIVQKSNPEEVLHSGWLQVKVGTDSEHVKAKDWPRRYAELKKAKMVLFESMAGNDARPGTSSWSSSTPTGLREVDHFTTLSMSLLQFPKAGRKKKVDRLFSITTSRGVTTFRAQTTSDRDKWLEELRRLVPLVKMEKDQEMIQKKAEEQAAREVSEFQRQDALKTMLAAVERVGFKETFTDYVDDLSKNLQQLLSDVGKVSTEGMNVAKIIADTLVEVIDSSNSLLANSTRLEINQHVLGYTRKTAGHTVDIVTFAKTSVQDKDAKAECLHACQQAEEVINEFLSYLKTLRGVRFEAPQKTEDRRRFKSELRKSFKEMNSLVTRTGVALKRQPVDTLKKREHKFTEATTPTLSPRRGDLRLGASRRPPISPRKPVLVQKKDEEDLSELAELRRAHRAITGAQEMMKKAVNKRMTMKINPATTPSLASMGIDPKNWGALEASPKVLQEASNLVDDTSELMALAIACHEEKLQYDPNSGAEFLIISARLVTLAILKLVEVVDKGHGNNSIAAAACCLKGSVARLLMSSMVGLPKNSPAGQKLNAAANKIYGSTQTIKDVIRSEEDTIEPTVDAKAGMALIKQQSEALAEYQAAELALENARKDLPPATKENCGNELESQKAFLERSFLAQKKVAELEVAVVQKRKIMSKLLESKPRTDE